MRSDGTSGSLKYIARTAKPREVLAQYRPAQQPESTVVPPVRPGTGEQPMDINEEIRLQQNEMWRQWKKFHPPPEASDEDSDAESVGGTQNEQRCGGPNQLMNFMVKTET